jgi:FixJ family two-component response regulator
MSRNATLYPLTVFIVDDDAPICHAIGNVLESEGFPQRTFSSTEDFLAALQHEMPGCLLLDVRLPGMTGVDFQERLNEANIPIPIIFMTACGDIPMVKRVMKAGAIEFLIKPFQREELLAAVHAAFERDSKTRRQSSRLDVVQGRYNSHSPREREVMKMVVAGLLNKQIAAGLGLSEITVKFHRRHVMEKIRANSLADLVRIAEILK